MVLHQHKASFTSSRNDEGMTSFEIHDGTDQDSYDLSLKVQVLLRLKG
jgi:hypothetical protein